MSGKLKIVLFILLNLCVCVTISFSQSPKEEEATLAKTESSSRKDEKLKEKHILVAMRMIGHRLLLDSGDSTSRVFPIEKEGESYKIHFASAFEFNPGDLAKTIDQVVRQMKIASSYIVEVKRCESEEVVYSYEKGDSINPNEMPCGPRFQSKACYMIYFTILTKVNLNMGTLYHAAPIQPAMMDSNQPVSTTTTNTTVENNEETNPVSNKAGNSKIALQVGFVLALLGLVVYFRKRQLGRAQHEMERSGTQTNIPIQPDNPETVIFGNTRFDQKNMVLVFGNEKTELSSKESDLLSLLHAHVNKTIEREQILKVVWGDEGDYIGRTLDVFVSKLRKKLESDERVKIVNIRGIGYKFIVN